jgi:nitrogen regulatory protein PII
MSEQAQKVLIVTIVNAGFVDLVMDAAKRVGATGGTVLHGRGTGNPDIEKTFGITIHPDKDIVFIVVNQSKEADVLKSIYRGAGLDTRGQGIAFSLPLSETVGLQPLTLDDAPQTNE